MAGGIVERGGLRPGLRVGRLGQMEVALAPLLELRFELLVLHAHLCLQVPDAGLKLLVLSQDDRVADVVVLVEELLFQQLARVGVGESCLLMLLLLLEFFVLKLLLKRLNQAEVDVCFAGAVAFLVQGLLLLRRLALVAFLPQKSPVVSRLNGIIHRSALVFVLLRQLLLRLLSLVCGNFLPALVERVVDIQLVRKQYVRKGVHIKVIGAGIEAEGRLAVVALLIKRELFLDLALQDLLYALPGDILVDAVQIASLLLVPIFVRADLEVGVDDPLFVGL